MGRFCLWSGKEVENFLFFFQAEDGIRYRNVTGVQTCALPISGGVRRAPVTRGVAVHRVDEVPRVGRQQLVVRRAATRRVVDDDRVQPGGTRAQLRSEERRVGKECRSEASAKEVAKRM